MHGMSAVCAIAALQEGEFNSPSQISKVRIVWPDLKLAFGHDTLTESRYGPRPMFAPFDIEMWLLRARPMKEDYLALVQSLSSILH